MEDSEADRMVLKQLDIKKVTYPMNNLGNTCFFNSVM
jgi:ubiquitin C-terminal hydrolase